MRQVSGRSGLRCFAHSITLGVVKLIKSGMLRLAGYVVRMQVIRNVYEIFVGKPEWKRRVGTPRYRWWDNTKMDLKEIVWGMWTGCL